MSDTTAAGETTGTTDDVEQEGVLERVADDVKETAQGAASFVARMGGALSEGFQDGRARS